MPRAQYIKVEEYVADLFASNEGVTAPMAIAAAVSRYPKCPAIDAAFAFVSVVSSLEEPFFLYTENDEKLAIDMYRSIAAFTADIYAVEKLFGPSPTCSQIKDFWVESNEAFFTSTDPKSA